MGGDDQGNKEHANAPSTTVAPTGCSTEDGPRDENIDSHLTLGPEALREDIEDEDDRDTFHDAETKGPTQMERPPNDSVKGKTVENETDPGTAKNIETPDTNNEENHGSEVAHNDQRNHINGEDTTRAEAETQTQRPEPSTSLPTGNDLILKRRENRTSAPAISEWSHQKLAPRESQSDDEEEEETWQAMPALGEYDIFDDDGRLVAKGGKSEIDEAAYSGLGGAGKGYTRVQLDEDAQSATSMDDDTNYLFKDGKRQYAVEDDEEQRDAVSQLQATKDLLTEGQRIAYVGVTRLTIFNMITALEPASQNKSTKKDLITAVESMEKWGQQMMVRLYGHMEINSAEQLMIEQLAEHGVQPADLVPPLMRSTALKNSKTDQEVAGDKPESKFEEPPPAYTAANVSRATDEMQAPLQKHITRDEDVPEVKSSEEMPQTDNADLDLRWTVLCDLFLVLIGDSIYDSRSRYLLEQVASAMDISWVQICRFEKRVIDALEMQEEAAKENWNESDHMENRRKMGLKKKYMVMGIATVGGGLVIGLSAGLLAPVIGAGLAAGFTTIGVTGTAGFLGGVGGAALITSAATAAGGTIAVRASNRRTGHVKTFEYRPLHNNKRLNLILTVSGWMTGKVDDVRLPYSTVDPIMGDIYSLLWEPEMLQSMGDTISILATEALTQTVQQVLGSTILVALMASLQLPVVLTKLSYLIDNPWTVSLDRANAAGLILADSLIDRHLGQRPITLVGFSLGSRLIFACLRELAARGAYGLVQNVYLFGSPIVAKKDDYLRARSVISGRFVNGYASNDWILGYLFRATSGGIMRVAGLAPVEDIAGLENIDVTAFVNGHMAYRAAMPKLLREVGWEVESDEFTEIEDPDPENHQKRQRELIQEIDDARKRAEEKPEKKRFGLFKRGKLAEKKGWEMYDVNKNASNRNSSEGIPSPGLERNVLFDIDAIRRELESEMIEVRELDSTLPPMQISTLKNDELDPDELAAMKLPPRPDEIDDVANNAPDVSRPAQRPATSSAVAEEEYEFEGPRELKSTLPPLRLIPSPPQEDISTPNARPDLKSHMSMPASSTLNKIPTSPTSGLVSPIEALNLEHNAWAEYENNRKEGEITITFGP